MCKEGLNCLERISEDMKHTNIDFNVTLAFDEVFIRQHVQYVDNQKKFLGFITYGDDEDKELSIAKQAIVFMVNGINEAISIPVAHQFVASLTAEKKAKLLLEVIHEISKTGAKIINITFDGLAENFTTCKILGASFDLEDFRPYFLNPFDGSKIRIILDPPHMLKLARNCLEKKKTLYDLQNRQILWSHLVSLESLGAKNEFLTHKLTKKHINIVGRKMNVRIAAQTFSASVSNSLEYLRKQGHTSFEKCDGTAESCSRFDKLFNIFNTMHDATLENKNSNIFRIPLNKETSSHVFEFLNEMEHYIKGLRLNKRSILTTQRKTGFLGFLINIHNLKCMFNDYVVNSSLLSIPTYQIGQDPLESFFSRLRSQRGCDDSLTVEQFKSTFRKVLVNREITSSIAANCRDRLNILKVASTQQKKITVSSITQTNYNDFEFFSANDYLMNACEDANIVKISANIESKLRQRGRHSPDPFTLRCLAVLEENNHLDLHDTFKCQTSPCVTTTYICKVAKKYFGVFSQQINFDYDLLFDVIINKIDYDAVYPNTDFSSNSEMKDFFVQFVVEEFVRGQATHLAKAITMGVQQKAIRTKLKKTIHQYGQ